MKILIVGGVAGGATAAARIRRNSEEAEIIMFEKGDVNRNHECTENGKENAQKTVTTVHKNQ